MFNFQNTTKGLCQKGPSGIVVLMPGGDRGHGFPYFEKKEEYTLGLRTLLQEKNDTCDRNCNEIEMLLEIERIITSS